MKHIITVENGEYPITLEMHSSKKEQTEDQQRFKVTYGLEVHKRLDYYNAAKTFGFCYFHMLACAGKFDQEQPQ